MEFWIIKFSTLNQGHLIVMKVVFDCEIAVLYDASTFADTRCHILYISGYLNDIRFLFM